MRNKLSPDDTGGNSSGSEESQNLTRHPAHEGTDLDSDVNTLASMLAAMSLRRRLDSPDPDMDLADTQE